MKKKLAIDDDQKLVSRNELVKAGTIVSGVVERVTHCAIVIDVTDKGHFKGTICPQHLADHSGLADLMKSVLRPGYVFNELLVLDRDGSNLVLSAKNSLLKSAQLLPLDIHHVRLNSVLHGYISDVTESGVFVRFLGPLTGFSPRSKAIDDKTNISEVYQIGQSVCTGVVDVSIESSKITLSLEQSLCSSADASFIQEYFLVEEKIAKLNVNSGASHLRWVQHFNLGSTVKGKVDEQKESGVSVSFQKYGVSGFIPNCQLGELSVETGSNIYAAVLDVSKLEQQVDLSLKPHFVNKSKKETADSHSQKKRKRKVHRPMEVKQTVNAVVEIVKTNYLVLSLPLHSNTLGYASRADYNTQNFPPKTFANGESVVATVMALPSPSTSGRLLLHIETASSKVGNAGVCRKKHAVKKAKRLREQEIQAAEKILKGKDIPKDEEEFEELVKIYQNSSFAWIKYMAFVLSRSDVDAARSLADRALREINVEEESEKLNVWVAYFNLENDYGSHPEKNVRAVFQRALKEVCKPRMVYLALLGMYERTEQHGLRSELLNTMIGKFKKSCMVWLRKVQWQLKENPDEVQSVVDCALKSLRSREHIKFIKQTAILEFKHGVPGKARSLLNTWLEKEPQKTDLWDVYFEQEVKMGDADHIEALLQRARDLLEINVEAESDYDSHEKGVKVLQRTLEVWLRKVQRQMTSVEAAARGSTKL